MAREGLGPKEIENSVEAARVLPQEWRGHKLCVCKPFKELKTLSLPQVPPPNRRLLVPARTCHVPRFLVG